MALGSLHGSFRPAPAMQRLLWVCCRPIRGAAIRVDAVPVVHIAGTVDVISIHVPRERDDRRCTNGKAKENISIHVPRERDDDLILLVTT